MMRNCVLHSPCGCDCVCVCVRDALSPISTFSWHSHSALAIHSVECERQNGQTDETESKNDKKKRQIELTYYSITARLYNMHVLNYVFQLGTDGVQTPTEVNR